MSSELLSCNRGNGRGPNGIPEGTARFLVKMRVSKIATYGPQSHDPMQLTRDDRKPSCEREQIELVACPRNQFLLVYPYVDPRDGPLFMPWTIR